MVPSPNHRYLTYKQRVQPMTNDYELHLAMIDGSMDIVYAAQHGLEFLNWHPDSARFVYVQWGVFRPFLGSVCGGPVPLLEPSDTPATQIQWVDGSGSCSSTGRPTPIWDPANCVWESWRVFSPAFQR
jgi:hypothetical protein